jgi:acetylornithine/succinyldiaminopimelate/putrescine aminotransferase
LTTAGFIDPHSFIDPTVHRPHGSSSTPRFIDPDEQWSTHNYHPLPVVVSSGEGAWITDVSGRRYLGFLAGYSALKCGHRHPAQWPRRPSSWGG